ncbi:NADH-quinone oxidoreductase subunit J [Hydrogenimonas sp.]
MIPLLLLTAVLALAAGSLFIKKTVPAMIAFALMMLLLGLFYLSLHAPLLGLFQIFVYTGGIVVLMLFGITIVGVEFPPAPARPWTAAVAFLLFVAMSTLFLLGRGTLPEPSEGAVEAPGLFAHGFADTLPLFALIGASLLYGTVKMVGVLKKRPRTERGDGDVRE